MALSFSDATITSRATGHVATAWPVPGEPTLWTVTWLPGRTLTRAQAITAMMLAEAATSGVEPGTARWLHVAGWAEELSLATEDAVAMASELPHFEG